MSWPRPAVPRIRREPGAGGAGGVNPGTGLLIRRQVPEVPAGTREVDGLVSARPRPSGDPPA